MSFVSKLMNAERSLFDKIFGGLKETPMPAFPINDKVARIVQCTPYFNHEEPFDWGAHAVITCAGYHEGVLGNIQYMVKVDDRVPLQDINFATIRYFTEFFSGPIYKATSMAVFEDDGTKQIFYHLI